MNSAKEIIELIESPKKNDISLIERAYEFAKKAHEGYTRFSGEPYFYHAAETAKILALYGLGATTVSAGLLHDTIEDTGASPNVIEKEFGAEILFLVEGVTKLGKLKYHGADRHNESLRKLFVAMSQDIRVVMIKLADRLHNMRTLSFVPEEKRARIAKETLEIFAPIAYRLGIRKLSRELEDLAFPFVYPKEYGEIKAIAKKGFDERHDALEKFLKSIKKELAGGGITKVRTEFRVKGLWSLFQKLETKDRNIEEVYDMLAVRVVVPSVADCYQVLGLIHGNWRPLPGRIKDYIAFPKPNGYRSLHTTVFTGDGSIVEVQIRTEEMHRHCEYGIASHISYKDNKEEGGVPASLLWAKELLPKHARQEGPYESSMRFEDVPHWIRELVEHYEKNSDNETFQDDLRSDFFEHRIFVFTPHGDVVDLPKESTPVDFAYSIHSEVGNHMVGAKVNGKLAALDTDLKNGDIVEIMTRPSSKPSAKWIECAKTSLARGHIRSAIQKQKKVKL